MISIEEFRQHAHQMVDWMADYYSSIDKYPVKSDVNPGDILEYYTRHHSLAKPQMVCLFSGQLQLSICFG
jgi:hypothetical protein